MATLLYQALDKNSRYKPVQHERLQVGDIVLLADPLAKQYNYPMGKVTEVVTNDLDEVTAAYIWKGATREKVFRHVTSLILLMRRESDDAAEQQAVLPATEVPVTRRSTRIAAKVCREKNKQLINNAF